MARNVHVRLKFRKTNKTYDYNLVLDDITQHTVAAAVSAHITKSRGGNRGMHGYEMLIAAMKQANIRLNIPEKNQKDECIRTANELQSMEKFNSDHERIAWRVGKTTSSQVILETDNTSPGNAGRLYRFLCDLIPEDIFTVVKTTHGYHFVGSRQYTYNRWQYINCMLLYNDLSADDTDVYIKDIQKFDHGYTKDEFNNGFRDSEFFNSTECDFDIMYTYCSIRYGKSTLRITEKYTGDNYEIIEM